MWKFTFKIIFKSTSVFFTAIWKFFLKKETSVGRRGGGHCRREDAAIFAEDPIRKLTFSTMTTRKTTTSSARRVHCHLALVRSTAHARCCRQIRHPAHRRLWIPPLNSAEPPWSATATPFLLTTTTLVTSPADPAAELRRGSWDLKKYLNVSIFFSIYVNANANFCRRMA